MFRTIRVVLSLSNSSESLEAQLEEQFEERGDAQVVGVIAGILSADSIGSG